MNPTAIYSKSGKGVQEASGKTSHLKRGDRAVLAAIDGRATLAEVAEKVGKAFNPEFEGLITQLDKDGFIREVNPGVAPPAPKGAAPAKGKAAPATPAADAPDLDFSALTPAPPPPPPPKPAGPSPAELKAKADAERRAKEQEAALSKARQEAEARAQADRERVRKEAEEKIRAETEARMRAEAEAKMKADTDAKAKVIRAAAEAKVKAEAEAKKAREEAERARREADEKAERARKEAEAEAKKAREEAERARREADEKAEQARREAEEKARREQEEMRKQLEAERKAREEAERKAKEEAERARKEAEEKARREAEEMRRQLEEERKRLEAERKREEEERKRRDEEERKRREEEERKREEERAARRKREEEEERKRDEERAERRRREEEEEEKRREEARKQSEATVIARPAAPPPPPAQPAGGSTAGPGFADSLLADLDSFNQREEEERKEKEEAERKARAEAERKAREAEERRRREEEERVRREAEDRRRREEEERRAREEEERREREEEERARREAEERKRKARESMAAKQAESATAAAAPAGRSAEEDIGVSEDDLDMDDVKRDEALVSAETKRRKREKEQEEAEIRAAVAKPARKPLKLGKPIALALVAILVGGAGLIHVMPVSVGDYERAASEAIGAPVKIGSGRVSLFTGVRVKFDNVTVGGAKIATVRTYPDIGSLFGAKKSFSRIELEGVAAPLATAGEALFGKAKGENFSVGRVVATQMKLEGPLALPALDAEIVFGDAGAARAVTLRGADGLLVKVAPKESEAEFDMTAGGFAVPFAPDVKFSQFGMKGTVNRQGMTIASWDGAALTGTLSGTANIRWGSTWNVEGVITARGLNAGVFAPALLSEGRAEGTGKFSMSGEPAQLASTSRLEGNFTVTKGALSAFDLSRAIQTGGRQASGRTQFAEMNGQATYDKGAVALRNVTMGAGALNAGISADIAESGALSGRIVADVKTATQTLRATFSLAGTVKEPQVK